MADGSLTTQIQTLQTALAGITSLAGEADAGTGLTGAAHLSRAGLGDRATTLPARFTTQANSLFQLDTTALLQDVTTLFSELETVSQGSPEDALSKFEFCLTQVGGAIAEELTQPLEQMLTAVQSITAGIPTNRTEVIGTLVQQILQVVASLQGPEAQQIEAWMQSVQALQGQITPLLAAAEGNPNPEALVIEFFQRSLDRVLQTFGMDGARTLLQSLSALFADLLPPPLVTATTTALTGTTTAYQQTLTLAAADLPLFQASVEASAGAMQTLKEQLNTIVESLRQVTESNLVQANGLEQQLRGHLERALAVQVRETQRIDGPFQSLFDRIDGAIASLDLSVVRTQVLDFFETTRHTLQQVNLAGLGNTLTAQLETVEGGVTDLQQGVTDLLEQIGDFFAGLVNRYRQLAEQVGEFLPDGQFRYGFEADLRQVFDQARLAIAGDPTNPAAPSMRGTLGEFQTAVEQFLNQLADLLQPVQDSVEEVKNTAVQGVTDFADFLAGLNVPQLMEELKGKVQEIVDALGPIDFAIVVDPVVEGIEENTAKLRQINPSDLNDLLKEALKAALDVVIGIDFTSAISDPLKGEFARVKELPQQAIDQLQQRYEDALGLLDQLRPEQVLAALLSAFEVVENAVNSLNLATLLQPLDDLHQQYLVQPLSPLTPSLLLQPVATAFQEVVQSFDALQGSAILAPLNEQLNALKTQVAALDLTGWVGDVLAAIDQIKQVFGEIRPSVLLQPLTAELARLETELDRFQPSVVLQPAIDLAAPLLELLENVQETAIDALYTMFQAPLQFLDQLHPQRLTEQVQQWLDQGLGTLRSLNLPAQFNHLKGQHFDLVAAVQAQGVEARLQLVATLDPEPQVGALMRSYNELLRSLEQVRSQIDLSDLTALYTQLRDRLLGMLPPYARERMNPDTFKRVMRLMSPARFLEELDQRFQALKTALLPIRPTEIAAELDAAYDAVLTLVNGVTLEAPLTQVTETIDRLKGVIAGIRIDFGGADLDRALADTRTVVEGLDPSRVFADLDALHGSLVQVVNEIKPSELLAELTPLLEQVQTILGQINPRAVLEPPLLQIWDDIQAILEAIDFRVVLSPLVDKLDELEAAFESSLQRTEDAFDQMLGAARTALN